MLEQNNHSHERESLTFFTREELARRIAESGKRPRGADKLLEELLQEKERFALVFQTEKNSHYFVLIDGSCFRMQELSVELQDEDDGKWRARPIADHVFFVDSSESEKLKLLRDHPGFALREGESSLASRTISLTTVKEGAVPFEYGFASMPLGTKPVFQIDGLVAIYKGSERNGEMILLDAQGNEAEYPMGVTHLGHAITNVLWSKLS